jgi:hypothetical protein
MNTARVTEMLPHKGQHSIQYFGVQRGSSGVIEIHSHAVRRLERRNINTTAKIKDSGGVAGILLKSQILQNGLFAIHATFSANQ